MTDQLFAKETLPISLEEEMRRSYLEYAMSVIAGRALPDIHIVHASIAKFDPTLLLARTSSLIERLEMCTNDVSGPHYYASFHDKLKHRLAITLPLGIRAPPGRYVPAKNTPHIGAFCFLALTNSL